MYVAAGRATRVAVAEQKNLRETTIAFARICRFTLMPALGESWNSAWIPDAVEALAMGSGVPGEIDVEWEAGARAARYLVEVLVVGTDSEFRRATTVRDTNATLTGFPPVAAVKVRIVAANAAGEAAPSDEETVTVRALAQAVQLGRSLKFRV